MDIFVHCDMLLPDDFPSSMSTEHYTHKANTYCHPLHKKAVLLVLVRDLVHIQGDQIWLFYRQTAILQLNGYFIAKLLFLEPFGEEKVCSLFSKCRVFLT